MKRNERVREKKKVYNNFFSCICLCRISHTVQLLLFIYKKEKQIRTKIKRTTTRVRAFYLIEINI